MVSRKHYAHVACALTVALAVSLVAVAHASENSTGTALEAWADAKCAEYGGEAMTLVEDSAGLHVVCYPDGDLVDVSQAEYDAAKAQDE